MRQQGAPVRGLAEDFGEGCSKCSIPHARRRIGIDAGHAPSHLGLLAVKLCAKKQRQRCSQRVPCSARKCLTVVSAFGVG